MVVYSHEVADLGVVNTGGCECFGKLLDGFDGLQRVVALAPDCDGGVSRREGPVSGPMMPARVRPKEGFGLGIEGLVTERGTDCGLFCAV